jgi:hypothetical protein
LLVEDSRAIADDFGVTNDCSVGEFGVVENTKSIVATKIDKILASHLNLCHTLLWTACWSQRLNDRVLVVKVVDWRGVEPWIERNGKINQAWLRNGWGFALDL